MEEAVDIIGRLWSGGPVTYSGKYFQVQVPELRPVCTENLSSGVVMVKSAKDGV
jgi:alkanesulfonate monooxygenase SsuD/methylene tetrahydromethanopterin reductase-like flavin-dependent oxidoreductase (luciferase family)